jgi:tetratricopeptide (TPR) repeat protein
VLAYNNLGYHLHLLGDPTARSFAEAGLRLAEAKGPGWGRSYLHSTLGEIALTAGDVEAAEHHFMAGLAIAEQRGQGERIAGLTANLGLVALRRGERSLALERLSTALAQADDLGAHHLAAQIRLWVAPLLPQAEARAHLAQARAIAEAGQRRRLLDDICRLEAEIHAQPAGPPATPRS